MVWFTTARDYCTYICKRTPIYTETIHLLTNFHYSRFQWILNPTTFCDLQKMASFLQSGFVLSTCKGSTQLDSSLSRTNPQLLLVLLVFRAFQHTKNATITEDGLLLIYISMPIQLAVKRVILVARCYSIIWGSKQADLILNGIFGASFFGNFEVAPKKWAMLK